MCDRVWPIHDNLKPLQPLEPARRLGEHFYALTRSTGLIGGVTAVDRQHARQGASFGRRGKRGALAQAIGRSHGGRTTKVHALTDEAGRPLALVLTPGNAHDLQGARDLLAVTGVPRRLLADRA